MIYFFEIAQAIHAQFIQQLLEPLLCVRHNKDAGATTGSEGLMVPHCVELRIW